MTDKANAKVLATLLLGDGAILLKGKALPIKVKGCDRNVKVVGLISKSGESTTIRYLGHGLTWDEALEKAAVAHEAEGKK